MPTLEELRAFVRLHFKQRAYDYPAPDDGLGVVSLGYEPDAFEQTIRAFADRFDVAEATRISYLDTSRPILSLHEGPQDAAFMFANRCVDTALARRLLAALEAGGTTLATKDYFGLPLRRRRDAGARPRRARARAAQRA